MYKKIVAVALAFALVFGIVGTFGGVDKGVFAVNASADSLIPEIKTYEDFMQNIHSFSREELLDYFEKLNDKIYVKEQSYSDDSITVSWFLCKPTNEKFDIDCFVKQQDGILYSVDNGEVSICGYAGNDPLVIIPSEIEGFPVASIKVIRSYGSVVYDKETGKIIGVAGDAKGDFSVFYAKELTIVVPDSVREFGYNFEIDGKTDYWWQISPVEKLRFEYNKGSEAQKFFEGDGGKSVTKENGDSVTWGIRENIPGDANGDNEINVSDIAVSAAHIKGIKPLTDEQQKAADVNNDDKVNVTDIAMIASHIKGIKALS